MTEHHIWVIDDDPSIRWVLEKALKAAGLQVSSFETADAALDHLTSFTPDAIITDIRMPGMDGLEFLNILNQKHPEIPAIIMTAHSDLDSAVSAYQAVHLNTCLSHLILMKPLTWPVAPVKRVMNLLKKMPLKTSPLRTLSAKPLPCRKYFVLSADYPNPILRFLLMVNQAQVKNWLPVPCINIAPVQIDPL